MEDVPDIYGTIFTYKIYSKNMQSNLVCNVLELEIINDCLKMTDSRCFTLFFSKIYINQWLSYINSNDCYWCWKLNESDKGTKKILEIYTDLAYTY
jgi:hypothetical protein